MAEFYTVSNQQLENAVLSLNKDYDSMGASLIAGWYTKEDVIKRLELDFPHGLSYHGIQYVTKAFGAYTRNNIWRVSDSQLLEFRFELIRQVAFPTLPSRFVCMFGWETADEARVFKVSHNRPNHHIYKIIANSFLKVDMNWLHVVSTYVGVHVVCHKYWSGEATDYPLWEVLLELPITVIERVE